MLAFPIADVYFSIDGVIHNSVITEHLPVEAYDIVLLDVNDSSLRFRLVKLRVDNPTSLLVDEEVIFVNLERL